MTESLYVSTTIVWVCLLIFALRERSPIWWGAVSVLLMTVILIRPSALYLIPLCGLVIIYMIGNRYSWKSITLFVVPALLMYGGLCTYNYIKINRFSISSQGTDMIGNVVFFLEKDPKYPEYINQAIESHVLRVFPVEDKEFIRTSWKVTEVQALQVRYQNLMYPLQQAIREANAGDQERYIADCGMVTWHAIKTHPGAFAWFTTIQMIHYFTGFHHENITAFPFLKDYFACYNARLNRYFYDQANKSGRFFLFETPSIGPEKAEQLQKDLETSPWHRFGQQFSEYSNRLFRNYLWLAFYFIVLIVSVVKLIQSRFHNETSFIVFAICSMVLLNAVFHSLVNIVMIRYTYALFWIYYLSPVMLLMLIPDGWFGRVFKRNTKPVRVGDHKGKGKGTYPAQARNVKRKPGGR
jgi:hypothetical protein